METIRMSVPVATLPLPQARAAATSPRKGKDKNLTTSKSLHSRNLHATYTSLTMCVNTSLRLAPIAADRGESQSLDQRISPFRFEMLYHRRVGPRECATPAPRRAVRVVLAWIRRISKRCMIYGDGFIRLRHNLHAQYTD